MKHRCNLQNRQTALAVAMSSVLMASPGAMAQDNDASDSEKLEEIVVTGREFQQSLVDRIPISPEDLPFTLHTIDREFLDARNFTRPIEALTTLPNITRAEDRQGTGTTRFFSRGFDAPTLVDNRVQNDFRGAGARDDSFVERYEVLKGPVSIASGPVGGGGIINTVTKSPEMERTVGVKLRADQFGSVGGNFDVNVGELDGSDTVLFRVSGAYRDFQFDADEVRRKTTAIRPVATFNLGSASSIKVNVDYTKHEVTPNAGFPLLQNGEIPAEVDTGTFFGYADSEGEVEDLLTNVEANFDLLDNLKLTVRGSQQDTEFDYQNTTGLYNYSRDDSLDYMYGFPNTALTDSEATFADAQLAFSADFWGRDQDFVVGIAHSDTSFDRFFNTYSYDGPYSLADIEQPRFGGGGSGDPEPFTLFDQKLKSVLAETALRPTDSLTIVGGIRYDQLDQSTVNFRRGNALVSAFDDSETTVRLGASIEATESVNAYASYSQAFVPQFGLRRNDEPVAAETSEGFEVGAKSSTRDGSIAFQAALFRTLRKDVALLDPNNAPNEFFVINAGEVRVQGVELSSSFNPTDGVNLSLSLGYTDIEAKDAEISAPVFPEVTGSFYGSYEIQSGSLNGLRIGGGLRHVGTRVGPSVDWDSYSIADLNFSYPINDQISLSFDILNLANERYVENTVFNPVNRLTGGAVMGPPRTAVLTFDWKM